MKFLKRGVAWLIVASMALTMAPVSAAGKAEGVEQTSGENTDNPVDKNSKIEKPEEADDIRYNLGNFEYCMTDSASLEQMYEEAEELAETGDDSMMAELAHYQAYGEDSNYTIELEQNAFFPYEVQFTENGEVTEAWFMSPEDTVTVGGHVFSVHSQTDGTAVTQMSLNVAEDTVVVYPEKKTFTNDGEGPVSTISLLPLETKDLTVDLSTYSPIELTRVSIDKIFIGDNAETYGNANAVVWKRKYDENDDYTVSMKGAQLDLSYGDYWEMIVGEADQLNKSNIRYNVTVQHASSFSDWLMPTCYFQKQDGTREQGLVGNTRFYISSYDDSSNIGSFYFYTTDNTLTGNLHDSNTYDQYISIQENKEQYPDRQYTLRAFEGIYDPMTDGDSGIDITDQLFATDMSTEDAGYQIDRYSEKIVTIVSYDTEDPKKVTGCLPLSIEVYNGVGHIDLDSIKDESGEKAGHVYSYGYGTNSLHVTVQLNSGYSADSSYTYRLGYDRLGDDDYSVVVEAAYAGDYDSMEAAQEAGAEDIKDALFGESGYTTAHPTFTIFGKGGKEKYQYVVDLKEYVAPDPDPDPDQYLSTETYIEFLGICDSEGNTIKSQVCDGDLADSYVENGYITILTKETDLKKIALNFYEIDNGIVLYSQDGKVTSRKTCFDFSKGPVQFTASSEDGTYQKNYWVQVINPNESEGGQQLYINSLVDSESNTEKKDGVICSTREVMLNGRYGNKHDILVVNREKKLLSKLSVDLQSNVVELDKYWTLTGDSDFEGFSDDSDPYAFSYEEDYNLAKIRIRAKETAAAGSKITGTLTIKSGETKLMELNLTGTVGDPIITTETIPQSVKYVPYGTMIQNNNKYEWNTVEYSLIGGKLPDGVELKQNGELYGVPKEAGEFTFTVQMENSYGKFKPSTKELTLTVADNTDENVEQATDEDYTLSTRLEDINESSTGEYLIVSEGNFSEYQDIYLDGEKLERNTDYSAESGSTRITIAAQALKKNGSGSHTIGIEFRDKNDEVKKAAQNYTVNKVKPSYPINNNDNNNNNNNNNNSNNNNNNNNSSSSSSSGGNSSAGSGNSSAGGGSSSGGSSSNGSNSGGNNNTNNDQNNVTENIETDDTEDASNTIVKLIKSAARAVSVKKPTVSVWQNLFDKQKIKEGVVTLLEAFERLLNIGKQ